MRKRYLRGSTSRYGQTLPFTRIVLPKKLTPVTQYLDLQDRFSHLTPEHKQKMDQLGQLILYKGPEEFAALWKELEVEQKALLDMAAKQKR